MGEDELRLECLRLLMQHTSDNASCVELVKNAKVLSDFVISGTTETKETN